MGSAIVAEVVDISLMQTSISVCRVSNYFPFPHMINATLRNNCHWNKMQH